MDRAVADFETRSACSIRRTGSWRYSLDPTTEPLCLAFRLPYWEEGRTGLWHPAFPQVGLKASDGDDDLQELFWWILGGGIIEAHNSWFERGIWTNIMTPRYGWPAIPHRSWRCSAAKAATYALPRALDAAGAALNLSVLKDDEGSKVMKKLMKPRKPRKKEREDWQKKYGDRPMPLLYHESADLFHILFRYCRQDVLAEEAVSSALDDLTPTETELFLLDQEMNERGFQVDTNAVQTALTMITDETDRLNAELCELTGGSPSKATQRQKMLEWFEQRGLTLPNTQKATIQEAIDEADEEDETEIVGGDSELLTEEFNQPLAPEVGRALSILQTLSLSSTAKYRAFEEWACGDGRVRGGLLYHGCSTGRWSGKGPQIQNLPKGFLKESKHPMATIWRDIKSLSQEQLEAKYNCSILKLLSHALRGAITASPGRHLFVADFAGIEARVLLWLAEDEEHLDLFRRGVDPYLALAEKIYHYPCTKENNPKERELGKAGVLGLGFGLGFAKFVSVAKLMAKVDITEDFSRTVVDTYRSDYWRVKQLWYDTEDAAIAAVENPGEPQVSGKVVYVVEDPRFLFCYLPSGRRLSYPEPEIQDQRTPWGAIKPSLTYKGIDQFTRKWRRQKSYGGMLVENNTQAVARELLAWALLNCAKSKVYTPVLSVHDEVIAEGHPLLGSADEFMRLLTDIPDWAGDCPITAEAWSGPCYRK